MSDTDDLIALAQTYLNYERCQGGRLVHQQYLCLHCGHDTSYGGCKKPTAARRKQMWRDEDHVWHVGKA